jgi:hypothetical protein
MKNIIYTFVLFTIMALSSCTREGVNNVPYNFADAAVIAKDSTKIAGFVNNIYTFLPDGYNRLSGTSMVASATDEAVHAVRGSGAEMWGTGSWGPTALYDNTFANCYTGIRRTYDYVNLIEPLIRDIDMGPVGRKLYRGQVYFLRAFYNFELLKRFGGYPIVLDALKFTDDLNIPRSKYDDCVKYISDLCDSAAVNLPTTHPNTQLGRATKGAAMALKARLLLYAASPLFNDASKPNNDLEHGAYDAAKWKKAAQAAAAVINLNVYDLYTDYRDFFTTLVNGTVINKEIILSKMATANNSVESQNGPAGYTNGQGGTCPTLDLVNDYEMKNGVAFDWNNPAHAAKPFFYRDPRFGKSILFNDTTWIARTPSNKIETFETGKDKDGNKATRTSFYLRKFLSITANWNPTVGTTNHCFPLLRYGEVLLNYAEAMNEAYGPDADPDGYGMTARAAVTKIRTRAGLVANKDFLLTTGAYYAPTGDKDKFRTAIQHERRIELAFEEHRHLDLRRWKLAESVLDKPVHGLTIVKTGTTYTYTPIEVEPRVFTSKMYLYPFPESEMSRNKSLVQNTGW